MMNGTACCRDSACHGFVLVILVLNINSLFSILNS